MFERAQQPAEVAGVEVETGAQGANVGRFVELPEHPGRAERPARSRYSSFSAPMRWVTVRLKRRTERTASSSTSLTLVSDIRIGERVGQGPHPPAWKNADVPLLP